MTSNGTHDFLEPPQSDGELGRLGPYRVVGLLGKGGMGHVYQAEDTRLQRTVALKVMNQRFASTPHSRQRFIDEARSMAAVQHDNVAMIFEVGQKAIAKSKSATPFMAMEMLQGETLEAALAAGRTFDVDEILSVARQTASGLVAAHERGITHRDIKPANLWIQATGDRIKILDFGLALSGSGVDQLSETGSVVGTPGYLAPEQARNEPVDDRTDLYALGVVMYEMATGKLPLLAKTVAAHLITIICHEPTPITNVRSDVPEPLANLIMRLLSKEPRDRIATATDLVETLDHVSSEIADQSQQQLSIEVVPEENASTRTRTSSSATAPSDPSAAGKKLSKWLAMGTVAAAVLIIAGWSLSRPRRVAQTPRPLSSDTAGSQRSAARAPVVAPVSVDSLETLQIESNIRSDGEVPAGRSASFIVPVTNIASTASDDPRVRHATARMVAKLVPVLKSAGRPERVLQGNAKRFSPKQLPAPGETKMVTLPLFTSGLTAGRYDIRFELQTPGGETVSSQQSTLAIGENLLDGDLVGFNIVRTHAGRGADTTIRRDSSDQLGSLKGIKVSRKDGFREHAVIRFDLTKLRRPDSGQPNEPNENNAIDRSVLLLTIGSYGTKGRSDLRVYGWPNQSDQLAADANVQTDPSAWNESGEGRLTWANSPITTPPAGMTYLGSIEVENQGDAMVGRSDAVRLASPSLDDFVRSQRDQTVTVVLVRENYASESTRLISKEGDPEKAPGLAIRWR